MRFAKREQISPNRLAYNKSSDTLAVFVRRASRGDCAFSKGGLDYLDKALALGVRGDGGQVRESIVICTEADDKSFKQYTAAGGSRLIMMMIDDDQTGEQLALQDLGLSDASKPA